MTHAPHLGGGSAATATSGRTRCCRSRRDAFGIAAIAALVGLFTDNAMQKLRDVMNALLGEPDQPKVERPDDDAAANGDGDAEAAVSAGPADPGR